MAKEITIIVNGLPEKVPEGSTIAQIIELLEEGHKDLITELNGRFVNARDYENIVVTEGARIEFILAAFGG